MFRCLNTQSYRRPQKDMCRKQNVLLWPLQVHARLLWESCEHLLLLCSEGGDRAGRWSRGRSHKGSADLLCCGHSNEKLVVDNAQPVTKEPHTENIRISECFYYTQEKLNVLFCLLVQFPMGSSAIQCAVRLWQETHACNMFDIFNLTIMTLWL